MILVKVVIRGERQSGKTALFQRLQGTPIDSEYTPSPKITTGHMRWTSRISGEDVVKIEIWDVVDKAIFTREDMENDLDEPAGKKILVLKKSM